MKKLFIISLFLLLVLPNFYKVEAATYSAGALIAREGVEAATVYYIGSDGKKYIFPDSKTYFTWYENFDNVKKVSLSVLDEYPDGGTVPYRGGVRLITHSDTAKIYGVEPGGIIRWLKDAQTAENLYGPTWYTLVQDVLPGFFSVSYTIGPELSNTLPTGTVVKTGNTYYYIEEGKRRAFDVNSLSYNNLTADNILELDTISTYPLGPALSGKINTLTTVNYKSSQPQTTVNTNQKLTVNDFLSAVVRLECYRDTTTGEEEFGNGSGYLYKTKIETTGPIKYFVATNHHVIDDPDFSHCNAGVYTADNKIIGWYRTDGPSYSKFNDYTDFALLELMEKRHYITDTPEILESIHAQFAEISELNYIVSLSSTSYCQESTPMVTNVFVIGYPASGMTSKIKEGIPIPIPQVSKIITTGIISGYLNVHASLPYTEYFTTTSIDAGNSGGLALAEINDTLCVLGQPTWVQQGVYANQGIIQNIQNIEYKY